MYQKYVKLRDEKGVSDYRVSEDTGITKSTFTDWKSGRSQPKLDKIKILADYFGVSIEYFINDEPEQKDKKPTFNDIRKEHGLSPVEGGDVVLTKE